MVIDVGRRRVTVFGREVMLKALELELLSYFLMHPDEPITRARLLEAVWGYSIGGTATVTVHVRRLREKIEVDPANPVLIRTVWGIGYQFSPSSRDRLSTPCVTSCGGAGRQRSSSPTRPEEVLTSPRLQGQAPART